MEAMVPFAVTNPSPASERRRVRNASSLFFSVMGRRTAVFAGGDGEAAIDYNSNLAARAAGRSVVVSRLHGGGGGGGSSSGSSDRQWSWGGEGGAQPHPPNLEEQLYAGLGSLLEVRSRFCLEGHLGVGRGCKFFLPRVGGRCV